MRDFKRLYSYKVFVIKSYKIYDKLKEIELVKVQR